MAFGRRDLTVHILGDSRSLERAFKKSTRDAKTFNSEISKTSKVNQALRGSFAGAGFNKGALLFGSGSFVGAAAGAAVFREAVTAASDLNEQVAKSREIFRGSSRALEQWADSAEAIGLSRDQALAATGTFGNLFKVVNLGPGANARMSRSLVQLGADLASFNNTDPTEALDALRSGLIGEAEPLRRYGVLLSEARVQQEAMAETGKKSAKSLTDQEKVLARYRIILRDTAAAQGDVARTSESFANEQRRLRAQVRNLAADLGTVALPVLADYIGQLNDGIVASRRLAQAVKEIPEQLPGPAQDPARALEGRARRGFGPGFKQGFRNILGPDPRLLELVPGIKRLERLKDMITAVRREAAPPVNFSAVAALTAGIPAMNAGLQAMQRIEDQLDDLRNATQTPFTPEQRRTFFDAAIGRKLDRVQDVESLRGQIAALKAVAKTIEERIALTKDITRRLNLEDQLLEIQRDIRSRQAEITENAADAARAATEKTKELAEAEKERLAAWRGALRDEAAFSVEIARSTAGLGDDLKALEAQRTLLVRQLSTQKGNLELRRLLFQVEQDQVEVLRQQRDARQFRQLGLGPTGGELIPGVQGLRRQLGNISDAVKGTFLDTGKTRSLLANIRRVLTGGLGAVSEEVRSTIRDMLRDIDQQLKQHQGRLTRGRATDTSAVLAGLGLSPDQIRELRGRISQISSTGRTPFRGQGAFGIGFPTGSGNIVISGPLTIKADNPDAFMRALQQTARRTPAQRGGRNGGQALGLA